MKVLFLPHNARSKYFRGLLDTALTNGEWQVDIVCGPGSVGFSDDVLKERGKIHLVPDFLKIRGEISEATKSLVFECEAASGVPSGQILLAGARDVGRGFSFDQYYWAESALALAVRKNPQLSRDMILRMFEFGNRVLAEAKPDVVITSQPAEPLHYVIALLCAHLKIPFVLNRHSKILSGHAYWTMNRSGRNSP